MTAALTNIPDALIAWARGSTRAAGQCGGFAGNDFLNAFAGGIKTTYVSALAAWNASSSRHAGAQPPEGVLVYCYWQGSSGDLKTYGHVALCVRKNGVTHKLMNSSYCTTFLNSKRTVGTRDSAYPATYLGWSPTYGANADITGMFQPQAAPPPPPPAPVGPSGTTYGDATITVSKDARRRIAPSTGALIAEVKAAAVDVYCGGYTDEGEMVSGSTRWFRDGGQGYEGWYHASTVSHVQNLAALPRLNPDGTPWPPVVPEPPADPAPEPEEPTIPEDPEPSDPEPEQPADPEEDTMPDTTPGVDSGYTNPDTGFRDSVTPEQEEQAAQLGQDLLAGKLDIAGWVHARIRTIVPLVVGPVLAYLIGWLPGVAAWLTATLPGWEDVIYGGVSALLAWGWWELAGLLGKRWPIVERIMLGSSTKPTYLTGK